MSFTGYANTGDIAGTYDSTTGLMTLTSAAGATKAQWQAALQSVQYRNTSATPTGLSRTISVIGFDGINMGQATAIDVLLQGSNNPPVLANTNVKVNTGVTNAISDSSFGFTDPDGNIMTDVRIDSLPTNGVLKLNGTAVSAGDVIPSNKLMNLTYTPNSDYYGPDSFTWNGSDGTVYAANNATISIKVNNNDATLSGITVGGTAINGFAPTTTDYTALLPAGTTTVPVVTATTTDNNATEVITNAATLSGTTTIVVTAEDGTTTNTYTINFTVAKSTDATLSSITVGGTPITGFAAGTTEYNLTLPAGTTIVPTIAATTTDSNASALVTSAITLPGTTTIKVTAENGTSTKTYNVNFTVDKLNAVTIAADKTELGMTNKGKISISGKLDSGIDADLTKADIQYVSSNPEVASVDNNGVITPNKEGNAVITAIVNLYGTIIRSNNIPIVVDYTAPVTSTKVIGNGSNDWYNSTVTVTLTSSDNLSGVDRTEYRIGESGDWIPYNKPFDINKEGVYTLEYRSIDRAGNIEETKQQFIKIDKTMPYFNLMVNGNNLNDGASFDDYLPLSFKVSDDLSGIASAKINIGGEVYTVDTKTQQSVDIDMAGKLGSFTALVTLEDVAGNKLETTLSFNVTTSIDSMMQLVNGYINSGDLYGPIIPQLTNDLNQVQHQLDIGRLDHAAKHLQDFADHLNNKALSNCSSEKAKTVLNADAQKILNN
ncbi:LPXTG-motif cell wall anchor domain-containing protein [Neobacillus massiliamazoniensis]|uniref:LPXTG-motif cell wall anchor domain-containing protein n=1 Tax=Neobacillus massiliamazoniensis TaxID=1499688 RepID=A0A0U1NQD0_9BACI|nr:LPXTG-motif cell wall anchor domain-containing protein [Neobacillus massiliamazoniensis]